MGEMLTIEEIEAPIRTGLGPDRRPEDRRLVKISSGGKVLFHGSDRDELYRKAEELGLDRIAVRYLGNLADDTALVLLNTQRFDQRVARSSWKPRSPGRRSTPTSNSYWIPGRPRA